jgi:ATP-dependent 26S proteasome regulatory subunit
LLVVVNTANTAYTTSLELASPPAVRLITPSHHHTATMSSDPEREHALEGYKGKLLESREWEAKLKNLRLEIKGLQHDFDVSEDNIKALQSVGQIIGEVLKQLDEERCMYAST